VSSPSLRSGVRSGVSSILAAPFVVLAVGVVVTLFLSAALSRELRGGWISLESLGPPLAWDAFALFTAVFLWLDGLVVSLVPERTWVGVGAMWWTTVLSTLGAVLISLLVGVLITGMTVIAMTSNLGWPFVIGVPACLVVLSVIGGVMNVRTRRTGRIVPRPF
jgi:hypothetical protein